MSYIVTNSDRMAMIEIMEKSWHVHFKSSQEKGSNYTRWDVQAVNPADTTYYSSDGSSIVEAVTTWFNKTGTIQKKPLTLYEAKAYEAEIIGETAQFYG
tara:strand:- start:417 stop:713 length:297 start_codon:yes stop_codon:yes gene_type:complete